MYINEQKHIPLSSFTTAVTTEQIEPEHGNWYLVRRVAPKHRGIHPATDNLQGTDEYGSYSSDTSSETFSVPVSNQPPAIVPSNQLKDCTQVSTI